MFQTKKKTQKIYLLPIEELAPNRMQPRKAFDEGELLALSESLKQHGFLQPITVRRTDPLPFPEDLQAPAFEIIAGERRWRAAKLANLEQVPCIIRKADKEESAYLALIENLQRKELGYFEEAEALRNLLLMTDYSQAKLAEKLSISPSALSNKLRLLSLPEGQRKLILEQGFGERHARAFLKIRDDAARRSAILQAGKEGLTAKAAEALADSFNREQTAFKQEEKPPVKKPHRVVLVKDLRFFFNTLERSLSLLEEAGFSVEKQRTETENSYEITLSVSKTKPSDTAKSGG
ncbi:MAG: ParB/RepB/Spo0J family partition protein [Ruminococcaceae bacterium]|nr:ParB/RepB/Spo0J family partition protein [Oscillospiraceae bacterium]